MTDNEQPTAPEPPCHAKPREQWCDHSGPGGFMGHTCYPKTFGTRPEVFAAIERELERAYRKHGREPWGRHEFYAILLEEVEEAWDDIKADAPQYQLEKEIIQVAAMCFRYLETKRV